LTFFLIHNWTSAKWYFLPGRYNGHDVTANTAAVISGTYAKLFCVGDRPNMIGTNFAYRARKDHSRAFRNLRALANARVRGLYPFTSKYLSRCAGDYTPCSDGVLWASAPAFLQKSSNKYKKPKKKQFFACILSP